jgi:hypothetical protein
VPEVQNLLDGPPPEAQRLLALQLKPKWNKADHGFAHSLTAPWTQVHREIFEDRFTDRISQPIRWR